MGKKIVPMSREMELAISSTTAESVAVIVRLLDEGEPIDARQRSTDATLLMLAIQGGLSDLACLLIERGADVNAKSAEGETALMYAARTGDIELVKALLEKDANPNRRSRSGFTAMQWAVLGSSNEEIVNMIRQAGGRFS